MSAFNKKAEDIVVLDVSKLVSYCDYFILCNSSNSRQAAAIADGVQTDLKKLGEQPLGIEGLESCRWVLIDYGDVLMHVFDEPLRNYYDLDGLWVDAPKVELNLEASA